MSELELEIQQYIKEWTLKFMGPSFLFRPYQEHTIIGIIANCLGEKDSSYETLVVEAPTGSGKSLICLIAAGVLAKYYNKTSYILCSDLYLYKQYEDVIKQDNLPFGMLKGSRDNYICPIDNKDLMLASCKLWKISMKHLTDVDWCNSHKRFNCANNGCEYINDYRLAANAAVTLMTYQLWLNFMNHDNKLFFQRDIIFCDECHNIPNIIQLYAQLVLCPKYNLPILEYVLNYAIDKRLTINNYGYRQKHNETHNLIDNKESDSICIEHYDVDEFRKDYLILFDKIYNSNNNDELYNLLYELSTMVLTIKGCGLKVQKILKKNKSVAEDSKLIKYINNVIEQYNTLFTYITAINNADPDPTQCTKYMIMNVENNSNKGKTCTLLCSKEDTLCTKYMLNKASKKVMLSATVGLFNSFCDNIGLKDKYQSAMEIKIPSTFDFSKSPIYYYTKLSMNKQNINKNMPAMIELICKIISSPRYKNLKGIIHTGSYKNTSALLSLVPSDILDRLYIYENSKDKNKTLLQFKESKNGILVGPTLVEGIDLPEDLCRFMIIMKIPYPNLGDKLVMSKNKLFPNWYYSETSNSIIQAIGRGNRTTNDYCETFILDNSFNFIYNKTKEQYPDNFIQRLKYIN